MAFNPKSKDFPLTTIKESDSGAQNRLIFQNIVDGIKYHLPIATSRYKVEMANFSYDSNLKPTYEDIKQATLRKSTLSAPVYADVTLSSIDGRAIGRMSKARIASIPLMTELHTFVIDGIQYSITSQLRLRPGIYTKKAESGETIAHFNMGKGGSFKLRLDAESGIFYWQLDSAKKAIAVYPILRYFGISDTEIAMAWGEKLSEVNKNQTIGKSSQSLDTLYDKFLFSSEKKPNASESDKVKAILSVLDNRTELDPQTTQATLGTPYTKLTSRALLDATKKMLNVFRGNVEEDERDSLEFKRIVTIEEFLKEAMIKERGRKIVNKIKARLNSTSGVPTLQRIFTPGTFTGPIINFIATESISGNPDQINPIEIMDQSYKVTPLGPGGISSVQSVTHAQRLVHSSHLGIIDPVRTPEGEKVGVDLRLVPTALKDSSGNLFAPFMNVSTKKVEYIHPSESKKLFIAFEPPGDKKDIEVLHDGEISRMLSSKVTHYIIHSDTMYGASTKLLPFLGNMQGNRAIMGSKQVAQALPLVNREEPLVQVKFERGKASIEELIGNSILPKSPVNGKVVKVEKHSISIKGDDGQIHVVDMADNLPFNSKTFLHHESTIKVGDKVSAGGLLADSNFTRNGKIALGSNLRVAYMPYHGLVHEDAVVISETGAKKLTSMHMYRKAMDITKDIALNKAKFKSFYPNLYSIESLNKLDDSGIIKKGLHVMYGEPIILALRKTRASSTDIMLGKLHKSFNNPYKDFSITWDKEFTGEIVDVKITKSTVVVTIKTETPAVEGDKIGGRYGNKGIISQVIPDGIMPHTEDGDPLDILMTPIGVVSRINPGQILESAVAKVAYKTGKPILVDNFDGQDKIKWAKDMLSKAGIKDKEMVFDPRSGKWVDKIMVGRQHILKLHKTVDTNFSARSTGGYDADMQPVKGGTTGAKGIGMMEVNVLLAHNARENLKEIATIKSQRNDEFWTAVRSGQPLPTPKENFAYNKFIGMLQGMNIKVNKEGSYLTFGPLTDNDVTKISKGSIENPKQVKSKNLEPEKGGLFDFARTGGIGGVSWSHIDLDEPVVNPIFEEPVQRLLGIQTKDQMKNTIAAQPGSWFKDKLNAIDLDKLEKEIRSSMPKLKHGKLDDALKRLKYIQSLKAANLRPGDAYVISKIPVLPPVMRPISVSESTGTYMIASPNLLYRDLMLINEGLKDAKSSQLLDKDIHKARYNVYAGVASVQGLMSPNNPQLQNKEVRGFMSILTGGEGKQPKEGYIQSTLLSRNLDFTGRGTASPDPSLAIDQIGIPEEQAWTLFEPFVMRRLTQRGLSPLDAEEAINKKTELAKKLLQEEMKGRPLLINRAPSLWRTNIIAAYPKITPGKVLKVQPFIEEGMNLDYDGDAITLHVPVTPKAVEEAKRMTVKTNFFSDKFRDNLLVKPSQEPVLGLYKATQVATSAKNKNYKTEQDAWNAYRQGNLKINDSVTFKR